MPNYVNKALAQFQHTPPQKQQDQSYPHVKPTYGAKKQYSQVEDNSPALDKARKKFIQEVCGGFLYLAQVVNGGLLPVLSLLASQQANPTEKTMDLCKQFGLHGNTGGCNTNLPRKQQIYTYIVPFGPVVPPKRPPFFFLHFCSFCSRKRKFSWHRFL
jgi:hypothetical protein